MTWDGVPDLAPVRRGRTRPRLLSCFRHGVLRVLVAVVRGRCLPRGRFPLSPRPLAGRSSSGPPPGCPPYRVSVV